MTTNEDATALIAEARDRASYMTLLVKTTVNGPGAIVAQAEADRMNRFADALEAAAARAALTAAGVTPPATSEHECESCTECLRDGHEKCCGCYDGVCCKREVTARLVRQSDFIRARFAEREVTAQDLLDYIYDPDEDDVNDSVRYGLILQQFEHLKLLHETKTVTSPVPVQVDARCDECGDKLDYVAGLDGNGCYPHCWRFWYKEHPGEHQVHESKLPYVTRLTLVGRAGGRSAEHWDYDGVELSVQDDGRTLKVFPLRGGAQ